MLSEVRHGMPRTTPPMKAQSPCAVRSQQARASVCENAQVFSVRHHESNGCAERTEAISQAGSLPKQ